MAEQPKILNAEIDVRSHFTAFDFPKLPEVIEAIEKVFNADITKVVKALRGPLMGLYRIQSTDYEAYRDKHINLRGQNVPVILRTQQERKRRDGTLITIYDAYSPEFQSIPGKDFDAVFMDIAGVKMIKQTAPQFYKGTRVLNGNRYFVAEFDAEKVDLGDRVTIGGNVQFRMQYEGMVRFCFLCNHKHGRRCTAKEEFERMKENRKDLVTHKIYSDSTLRHANQLALAADVACTSGGGIGQIVNAVRVDPDVKDNVVIFAGANEIRHSKDNHEFLYTIQKSAEKLHALTKTKKVTMLLPTAPTNTIEEKARYEILKETMNEIASINVSQIQHVIEYSDGHPTVTGTKSILGGLEENLEEQLILEPDHVTTERRYSQVQALYKMGCRACDSKLYTHSLCDQCVIAAKEVDISSLTAKIDEITSYEFPSNEDADMSDPNKRGAADDNDNNEKENGAKRLKDEGGK